MQAHKPDRRIERTRSAIRAAFSDLVLTVGYDRIGVRDIVERAGIGRSTFYEHFEDKEDVLRQSVTPVLAALAATVTDTPPPAELTAVVAHFSDNRRLVRAFFEGPPRRLLAHYLAALIEERLIVAEDDVALVPLAMIAAQLADSQLGLLQSWLDDPDRCSAATVTAALVVTTRAAVAVLLRPAAQRERVTRSSRAASIAAETAIRR